MTLTHWDQCYLDNQTPWDKGMASPPLEEWVRSQQPKGRALVPGCGIGHDVAMLVSQGVDAYGLDISPTAVTRAQAAYPELAERFLLGDLFDQPEDWTARYDLICEHTCLCALPPELRPAYEQAIARYLRPGGLLAGIWFINPEMDPGETGPPFGIPMPELNALFAAPTWSVYLDHLPNLAHPGREGRERLRVLRRA